MKKLSALALLAAVLAMPVALTPAFAEEAAEAKNIELQDGTTVQIHDGAVSVVNADGTTKPAPDGEHVAKDGSKINVKGGMLVE